MALSHSGRPISPTPSHSCSSDSCGLTTTFALAWLATGALLPVLGVAVIAAFNAFYWLPIRGENPDRDPEGTSA
jgi:hypothetical protein